MEVIFCHELNIRGKMLRSTEDKNTREIFTTWRYIPLRDIGYDGRDISRLGDIYLLGDITAGRYRPGRGDISW